MISCYDLVGVPRFAELVIASWPLSPFGPKRPGDRELAQLVRGHLPWVPAVLIDGTPLPWGPIIRGGEMPDYRAPDDSISIDDVQIFHKLRVPELSVLRRTDAPLTYCALEQLLFRYASSSVVRLLDVVPPEWLADVYDKFQELSRIIHQAPERFERLLDVPYPRIGQFDPRAFALTEPPLVPRRNSEMAEDHLRTALAAGDPELEFTSPPDIAEIVLSVPVDDAGRTLGGQIPEDLWRVFVDAPSDAEYLHEVLGVADTFCLRYSRSSAARSILAQIDPRILEHLTDESGRGYCEEQCLVEQRIMDEWIAFEGWNDASRRMTAQERLRTIESVAVGDDTPWVLISHRHQPSLEALFFQLEGELPIDRRKGDRRALLLAYNDSAFRKRVVTPRDIDRVWGFKPLMWQQLWSLREREGRIPRACTECGKKTGGPKYCSDDCRRSADARQQREYRDRVKLRRARGVTDSVTD